MVVIGRFHNRPSSNKNEDDKGNSTAECNLFLGEMWLAFLKLLGTHASWIPFLGRLCYVIGFTFDRPDRALIPSNIQ